MAQQEPLRSFQNELTPGPSGMFFLIDGEIVHWSIKKKSKKVILLFFFF